MPSMLSKDPVVAVCFSDLHLSLKPPIAREEEPSWLEAMKRALDEITALAKLHDAILLCAGDLFDRWNSPAELINFALETMPKVWAIPGNHDLPLHQPDLIKRSAYWTLVKTGRVINLPPRPFVVEKGEAGPLVLYGFPFGKSLKREPHGPGLHIALTHEYLWVPGKSYTGAPSSARLGKRGKVFSTFDVVVVGDNHQAFVRKLKKTNVINCGTVLRRKSNEADYQPQVGLIHYSGKVVPHFLDVSKDVITELLPETSEDLELSNEFIEELSRAQGTSLNFKDALMQALAKSKASKQVRQIILEAVE